MPARPSDERRLAPVELEAVVLRAIELHVRDLARSGDDLSEGELLRLGAELGLPAAYLRQALAEVDGGIGRDAGWLARHVGPPRAGASRVVARPAADAERDLDRYLVDVECMIVERRFPGRTLYVPATGLLASGMRAIRSLGGRYPLLGAKSLEVAIRPVESSSCCVAVAVDLARKRREHIAAALAGTGVGGGVAIAAGVAVAPPAALAAIPVAVAAAAGSRTAYRGAVAETASRLESLLDRLEHGELGTPRVRRLGLLGV
jgi:hypothetical protein